MKKYIFIAGVLAAILFGVWWRTRSENTMQSDHTGRVRVAASFYPLYYFVSEVGKDFVDVTNLTPFGTSPHDYEPDPKTVVNLSKQDVLVINGSGLEPWIDDLRDELEDTGVRIVAVSESLATLTGTHTHEHEHEEEHEGEHEHEEDHDMSATDPHVWLDPVLAIQEVNAIVSALAARDPQNADAYRKNGEDLKRRLTQLDEEYRQTLRSCRLTTFVTSHSAFGYLAHRYGLTQLSVRGLSPQEEPTASELAELTETVKTNRIRYVFVETLLSPKYSETLAKEAGVQTLVLDPVAGLSEDDVRSGRTYLSVMQDNLANLSKALECTP